MTTNTYNTALPCLGIAALLYIFWYILTAPYKYWRNRGVPHPAVSYVFGNISQVVLLKKSLGQLFGEIYNKYPELPFVGLYKPRVPCILLRDPDCIKRVLVENFNSFHDNGLIVDVTHDVWLARNPVGAKGEQWKKLRNQSTPLFTSKRIKETFPVMEGAAQNLLNYINTEIVGHPEGVEAKALCLKYTTDIIANCVLGLEARSFEDPDSSYIKMIKRISSPSFFNGIQLILINVVPSLSNLLKVKYIPDDAITYFRTIVSNTLEYRVKNKIRRGDFLDSIKDLAHKQEVDTVILDDITAEVINFFIDGTDTTAIALSFALYELGLHPDIQEHLMLEIREAIENSGGELTYDVIQRMEFLDQVVNESMRKNTTLPFFTKICTKEFNLGPLEENGVRVIIEPGTPVIIPVLGIHNDPKYYPDPTSFDPQRFSYENKQKLRKCTYLPFSDGPRGCLGQRFGIAQVKIGIVHVIKNFEIRVNKRTTVPYEIAPQSYFLSTKDGLWLDFYRRNL